MSLIVKQEVSERILVSEGVHLAVCTGIFDLGTQYQKAFDKEIHKVLITWEIPDERIKGDEKDFPMTISKKYTLSLHEKANLKKELESWRGKAFDAQTLKEGFDLHGILGKTCQLQIIHNESGEKTYANIAGIMALPKGTKSLEPESPLKFYSIEDELTSDIPEWIQNIVKESKEYQKEEAEEVAEEIIEEEEV